MMVIDTVHSSGVGRMHGRTGGMRVARPYPHGSQQAPEAKLILTPGMVAEKKVELDSSRPGLVIRRRIMVRQSEEADGRFHGLTPALSNQPNPLPTTIVNHPHGNTDHSSKHRDTIAFARSSSPRATIPQDQFRKSQAAMTKPPKRLRLFDLNKLPTVQENVPSPASSPTSTVASADSTTHVTTDHASTSAMATRSSFDTDLFFGSSSSMKRFRDEGDARGGALAVDLGLLAPAAETRRHSIEDSSRQGNQQFAFRKPQPPREADCYSGSETDVPTPARKRLRKLSEYAGGHSSATSMAKSWTTDGDGDGCNHRDVTKTLAALSPSQADAKVRRLDDDDKVFGAVAALLMLSSTNYKRRRRDFPFSSNIETPSSSGLNGNTSTFAGSHKGEEHRRETTPAGNDHVAASDNEAPSRSSGSGGSVLWRPRNKQRYRSMTEIMAQTPILRHGCSNTG